MIADHCLETRPQGSCHKRWNTPYGDRYQNALYGCRSRPRLHESREVSPHPVHFGGQQQALLLLH